MRLYSFHCENQRDLAFRASVLEFREGFADRETLAGLRPRHTIAQFDLALRAELTFR